MTVAAVQPNAGEPADVIRVTNLRKVFTVRGAARGSEEVVAVDDVSFSLLDGDSLAVVGESGSGKTTLVRMIVGLTKPTAGEIVVAGRDRSAPARRRSERLQRARETQIVFQDPYASLDPRQTVFGCIDEILQMHFPMSKDERAARIHELAEQVGLDERQVRVQPKALSGGQRQRVAIARALAAEPRVLVLDEAVASLDVSIQAQILNLLADIRESTSIAYLFITHDLAVVRQVAPQMLVMRRGSMVEYGPTERILEAPEHPYTRRLRESVPERGWKPADAVAIDRAVSA